MPHWVVVPYQLVVYVLARFVLRPWRVRTIDARQLPRDLGAHGRPTILAANHGSRLDGFLLCGCLPFRQFVQLLPFAFITKNVYFEHWWQRMFVVPLGLFPAFRDERYRVAGLELSQRHLDGGFTLVIFPEGRRDVPRALRPRRGVAVLAQRNNATVVPACFNWRRTSSGRKFARVAFGAPFRLPKGEPVDRAARSIMSKIYGLCGL